MNVSDFYYDLPDELIANRPPKQRGGSSLLLINRRTGEISPHKYAELDQFLQAGDVLVINNTKVIKARLLAEKPTGGKRELIVLENHGRDDDWFTHNVLYHGHLKAGDTLLVGEQALTVTQLLGNGIAEVKSPVSLLDVCEKYGQPPLPPYMKRAAEASDVERYQTVFAHDNGSVAAPTASLNMTDELLAKLRAKGVKIAFITLHVGLGTFLPIREDDVTKHTMHREYFEVPLETIVQIGAAKQAGRRVVALGTTVTRTLEYNAAAINDMITCLSDAPEEITIDKLTGEADIFIYPGYKFKLIDALLTNFHAPKSTVLMMAAAFAGWPLLLRAYELAIERRMRFLSYGDSMLII